MLRVHTADSKPGTPKGQKEGLSRRQPAVGDAAQDSARTRGEIQAPPLDLVLCTPGCGEFWGEKPQLVLGTELLLGRTPWGEVFLEANGFELCTEGVPGGEKPRRPGRLGAGWMERGKGTRGIGWESKGKTEPFPAEPAAWEPPGAVLHSPEAAAGSRAEGAERPSPPPVSSRAGTERPRGPGSGFLSTGTGLPGHPEEYQGVFSSRPAPWEARALSESERSGQGARPRRGAGGRPRRLRLGAGSRRGR